MAAANPNEFEAALSRQFGGAPVEVRETHISFVFLVAGRAYKLKKPVVLPFLDYGTAVRRRLMCAEEVRLNRRLAADVYLGVRAVVSAPGGLALADEDAEGAIDYVVEMRRYDERHTLAALVERGELRGQQVTAVAGRLQAFHAACPSRRGRERGSSTIRREISENVDELLEVVEAESERERIQMLAGALSAFIFARADDLNHRRALGYTRECHGDLRAEHVVIERAGESTRSAPTVTIVDCIEFDRALRTLDVADDLAFLIMDLAALGGERFGEQLVDAYRAAGGDCGDDALLGFFAIHRALVRAKVLMVRAAQHPPGTAAHGRARVQARALLGLAERYRWRALGPIVVVVCGVPASGKSRLARALAERMELPHLSSDHVRKRLARIRPSERARPEHYSGSFNRLTYAELGRRAAQAVEVGLGAIVDATFRNRADRASFAEAFADAAPVLFIECRAPAEVLLERARSREHDRTNVSDATPEVVQRERSRWQPLTEVPVSSRLVLRTDRPVDELVTLATDALSARASAQGRTGARLYPTS